MGQNIAMAKPIRTPESIRKSKKTEIDKWMERVVVERWPGTEALKTGVPTSKGTWAADPLKEKRRYFICEQLTHKDPAVFAAASDHRFPRIVDVIAIK